MESSSNSIGFIRKPVDPQVIVKMLYFTELVKAGSISKASEAMQVSTSTGSRWLADLERDLGITLYRRGDKAHPVTEAGQYLFSNFLQIYEDIHAVSQGMSDYTAEVKGDIRVCCSPVYAHNVLLPIIVDFVKEHPDVNIHFVVSPRGLEQYKDHDLIISAIAGYAPQDAEDLNLVRRNLLSEKQILVASREFVERHGSPRIPSDIKNFHCLYAKSLYAENTWMFERDGKVEAVRLEKIIELSDNLMIRDGVLRGVGLAYLPEVLIKKHLESRELVHLLDEYDTGLWLLNLYYPPQRFLSAGVKKFKSEFIKKHRSLLDKI
ncbi:LysR family transcriptional regulator [Pseudovibrio exalbescens]|uniref:LysR family transcriptional regulator n=1 Tax=Pseudovibrio exalbescens TaxID=197461 RepID=UPI000C9A7144|nr:LysR family transcriptional regulator [Pseudovibrio exalbescens]